MMVRLFRVAVVHLCLPSLFVLFNGPSLAQGDRNIPDSMYRSGQQPVLEPKETDPRPESLDGVAIRNNFKAAYLAAKRPRIAVFWNRKFSDQVSDWFVPVRSRSLLSGEGNAEWSDGVKVQGRFSGSQTNQVEVRKFRGSRGNLPERQLSEFEDAFYQEFLEAGTRLVDRSSIIRLARNDLKNALEREKTPEIQVLETESLKDYADLLMELIFIGHGKAKYNAAVRITVKRVLTGQVIASNYAYIKKGKKKEESKRELVSGPGGFYRKPPEPKLEEPADLAQQLALETMQKLAGQLKL